jgi:anti-sigma regulatory factor (Ser/Thr protein kinase)
LFVVGVLSLAVAVFLQRSMRRSSRRIREVSARVFPRLIAQAEAASAPELETSPPTYVAPDVGGRSQAARVERAFHSVADSGVRKAVEVAALRHHTADTLGYVGRRNHRLVSQGLRLTDQLQATGLRSEQRTFFTALQSQLVGMQRDAARLLVLAGLPSMRGWDEPVALSQIVDVAIDDANAHHRVNRRILHEVTLSGSVAADVTHILAELLENAATFSDEEFPVVVVGESLDAGYQIRVIDQGLGVEDRKLAGMNNILANGEVDLHDSRQLGLSVVARLAFKNGIDVSLSEHAGSGLVARVLIPSVNLAPSDARAGLDSVAPEPDEPAVSTWTPREEPSQEETPQEELPRQEPPAIDVRPEAAAERTEIRTQPWVQDVSTMPRRVRGATLVESPWDLTESAVDPRSDGPDLFGPALAAIAAGRAEATDHLTASPIDDHPGE